MSERSSRNVLILWAAWSVIVLGGMAWKYTHLPDCIALYGVYSHHDSTDLFLDCENGNTETAFMVQAIVLGLLLGGMLVIGVVASVLETFEKWRWRNGRKVKP